MKPADVIIVLGAAVWRGGRPSPALEKRVERGVQLLEARVAPRLLLTGGLGRNAPSEAEVMRRLAIARGADPGSLVLEDKATSTFESACLCAEIMRSKGWKSAIVVTDGYHLPRSLMTFRAFGVISQGVASAGGRLRTLGWPRWLATVFRETLAFVWYTARLRTGKRRANPC